MIEMTPIGGLHRVHRDIDWIGFLLPEEVGEEEDEDKVAGCEWE